MLLPYTVDVPMPRWPIANWAIIALTVVVGFPCWSGFDAYAEGLDASGSLPFLVLLRDEGFHWTQLIGTLFGHADVVHLLGNMWMLYLYGNAVNAKVGQVQYVLLYFSVGILESLVWLWLGDGPATLGASGAVMGMIGAFLVLYPHNNVSVFYWLAFFMHGTVEVSAYIVIGLYVAMDLLGFFGGPTETNHLAHLAGAGFGFAAMLGAVASGLVKADPGEITIFDIMKGKRNQVRGSKTGAPMRGYRAQLDPFRGGRSATGASQPPSASASDAPKQPPKASSYDDSPIPFDDPPRS